MEKKQKTFLATSWRFSSEEGLASVWFSSRDAAGGWRQTDRQTAADDDDDDDVMAA